MEYLKNHLEPKGKPKETAPQSIIEPLAKNIDFNKGEGKIEIEKNGLKIEMFYGKTNSEEVSSAVEVQKDSDPRFRKGGRDIKGWKELMLLRISDQDDHDIINWWPSYTKESDGEKVRVRVIFPVTNNMSDLNPKKGELMALFSDKTLNIFTLNNITSPCTIMAIAHEVGHIKGVEDDTKKRYLRYIKTLDMNVLNENERRDPMIMKKIAEVILREERRAWAFAIKILRPLIKGNIINAEDFRYMIYEKSLQSYSDHLRRLINPSLRDKIIFSIIATINTLLGEKTN